MNGLCWGSTPKSPSAPGTTTMSTSAVASSRSGATSWKATLSATPSTTCPALCLGGHTLGLVDRFLDRADHVERALGQVVVLAGDDRLEPGDGVLERHEHARRPGEHLGHVERLREKSLQLARAGDHQLV